MSPLQFDPQVARDLKRVDRATADRVLTALERLDADDPAANLDVVRLAGLKPWLRIRVGAHRALFRITRIKGKRVVFVARVIHRRDLEKATKRLT